MPQAAISAMYIQIQFIFLNSGEPWNQHVQATYFHPCAYWCEPIEGEQSHGVSFVRKGLVISFVILQPPTRPTVHV